MLSLTSLLNSKFTPASAGAPSLRKPRKVGEQIVVGGKKYVAVKTRTGLTWQLQPVIPASKSPIANSQPMQTQGSKPVQIFIVESTALALGESKLYSPQDGRANGLNFILTRTTSGVVAFDNICTHLQESVSVEANRLYCQSHGSIFNRNSGAVEGGPATFPLRKYPVVEEDGKIFISL